jgi:hypothetical protein
MGSDEDWIACHPINPQWAIRNTTAVYLERLAAQDVFSAQVNRHISEAGAAYRAVYECWQAAYALFGHGTTPNARGVASRRDAMVAIIRAWLVHETQALDAVARALAAIGPQ